MSEDKKPEVPVSVHEPHEANNPALPMVVYERPAPQGGFFSKGLFSSFFMGKEHAMTLELQKQKTEEERQDKGATSKKLYDTLVHDHKEAQEALNQINTTLEGNWKTLKHNIQDLVKLHDENNKKDNKKGEDENNKKDNKKAEDDNNKEKVSSYPEGFIDPDKTTKITTLLRSYELLLENGQFYKAKENKVLPSKQGAWCAKWYAGETAYMDEVKANLEECNKQCEKLAELDEKLEPAKQAALNDGVFAVQSKMQHAARMAAQNDLLHGCKWFSTGRGHCARVDILSPQELLTLVIAERCKTTAQKRAFNALATSFDEANPSLRAIENADAVGGSAFKRPRK